MKMRHALCGLGVGFACAGVMSSGAAADVTSYQFVIQSSSGAAGSMNVGANTAGQLIGNWDQATNPGGTRTKPGVIGPFGNTENVPVPLSLSTSVGGSINSKSSGVFGMDFDFGDNIASMNGYSANFLASGPVALPAEVGLAFDSFRTRSPDSLFLGGIPINLPIGEASLTKLSATQSGPSTGTLTPLGTGLYDFSVGLVVELTGEMSVLGQTIAIPAFSIPIGFSGQIQFGDVKAMLTSVQLLQFDSSTPVGQQLPQFEFGLPTILPPGETANVLMDLLLEDIAGKMDLTLSTNAIGTIVPAPGVLACVLPLGLVALRRKRPS